MLLVALAAAAAATAVDPALLVEAHRPMTRRLGPDSSQPSGYTPQQIQHAYGLDGIVNQGEGQTIGIVDGYDYPEAEADLGVFDSTFGLPACTTANGCFTVVYASGSKPAGNPSWTGETSLDLQWAHAMAPKAKILLIETSDGSTQTLLQGVPVAVAYGAGSVNMSWGTNHEFPSELSFDSQFFADHTVTYFNASGDNGNNLFGYPGASPLVVGAGGTTLRLDSSGNILSETAWSGSGGGESLYVTEPGYQMGSQRSGQRGVPDVAWNADPSTGFPVYDSELGQWGTVGGTSAASPQWAALTAIANSQRATLGKARLGVGFLNVVYNYSTDFNDIVGGSNGSCGLVCRALPGYDFVTGLGSPQSAQLLPALVAAP